jgi:hypothetical protein
MSREPMTTVTLQLEPLAAEKLQEKARLRGQTLEMYLQQLAEENAHAANGATAPLVAPLSAIESAEQWSAAWRAWASSHAALPSTADDSRESIYADRGE